MSGLNPLLNAAHGWSGASKNVIAAIQSASRNTGVSFDYLMKKARQESSFNPTAKASTSSASGLFQFIDSTWLSAVKTYGDRFGMGDLAARISTDGKVADAATKQQILSLRQDPEIAANITAAMTKDNADYLSTSLGDKVGQNELYLAHFMGLNGANKFLKARQDNPFQPAADLFPQAADANKNVFYDASGRKKSLDEVYDYFASKFDGTAADKVVTEVAALPSKAMLKSAQQPIMFNPSGNGFTISVDIAASQGIDPKQFAQRRMLETLLSGMVGFGDTNKDKPIASNNLLSPYTAMVMAQLQRPDAEETVR